MRKSEILEQVNEIINLINQNTITAWEDNLEETKEVVCLENFRHAEYNNWLGKLIELKNELEKPEQETPIETPWDFVEKYYPNYHGCDTIATASDLQKLLDEEQEEGDCAHEKLIEWYDGDIDSPQIQIDYDRIHKDIFERAIEGYINSLKK